MTSEQKLARQAMMFLDYGGKTLTTLLRMLLLAVVVVFEGIGRVFLALETLVENDAREVERAQKGIQVGAIAFAAMPKRRTKSVAGSLRP